MKCLHILVFTALFAVKITNHKQIPKKSDPLLSFQYPLSTGSIIQTLGAHKFSEKYFGNF
jgi:hypothetical protein